MFRLTRLPLRRCLHTAAGAAKAPRYRYGFAAGVAATTLALSIPTFALDTPSPVPSDTVTAAKAAENASTEAVSPTPPAEEQAESSGGGAQGGAYNPETGEINWDCPCLGGMADGPCGEEFKLAFSCFVHSEDEPKGINCVEKFQGMQNCFREHPEVYAQELMNDEDEEEADAPAPQDEPVAAPAPKNAAPVVKQKREAPSS